ncbi:HD domain-containing protein [Geodermatophilus sp. YIM 151500]|uniref:HD domain-containing protein n=1 Tax=Geodermatophilus sp. YIM 151500 TaxID=2984531 RepID=UPI0021E43259|nr:HD domain-containing protein [Geodermatophilus sp. YIM 151500]MCV2489627.1 HD domain-containing protein [Geodermatophilus sp. YIM 151500]
MTLATSLETLAALRPLLAEIGDAKRVRVASAPGSLAEQAFARAWARLVEGEDAGDVALSETAAAVARARLAGIDAGVLRAAGLGDDEAAAVLRRSFDEVAGPVDGVLADRLRAALPAVRDTGPPPGPAVALAVTLARQPRAGATAPGRARLVVEPPESHADHCLTVAVYGVLVAPLFDADPVPPFLVGLAHHLHNVVLPDAGFAGEVLLGGALPRVVATLEERELAGLPAVLAGTLRRLLPLRDDAAAPESRAFHAADVLDRVLQVHHHARAAAFTASQALDDLELVHAGPVQSFHTAVLAAAGL